MKEGDPLNVIDGKGHLIHAILGKRDMFTIESVEDKQQLWPRPIHLAVSPTKNIDRMEWMTEKATEIGVDSISFLECRYSQRRRINIDRMKRIAASAMAQSHKFYMPEINDIVPLEHFVKIFEEKYANSVRFIAHCYEDIKRSFILDIHPSTYIPQTDSITPSPESLSKAPLLVCIGPEGDFSREEVDMCQQRGFLSASLGSSRLRTETAAVVAVLLMHLWGR